MKNIIQLSAAELEQQGKFISGKDLVHLNNCTFKKGITFTLGDKDKVLKSYQEKSQNNRKYLLVEHKFGLVVWNEETLISSEKLKSREDSSIDQSLANHKAIQHKEISSPNLNNIEPKIPTKKIIKRYRGQVYEEVVPDLSSFKRQDSQPQPKRLKYRGKYID